MKSRLVKIAAGKSFPLMALAEAGISGVKLANSARNTQMRTSDHLTCIQHDRESAEFLFTFLMKYSEDMTDEGLQEGIRQLIRFQNDSIRHGEIRIRQISAENNRKGIP